MLGFHDTDAERKARYRWPAFMTEMAKAKTDAIMEDKPDSEGMFCRVLESAISQVREAMWHAQGFRFGRWNAGGPGVIKNKYDRRFWEYPQTHWIDHPYRVKSPAGKWSYVSEPYQLTNDGIKALATLIDQGWDITITAWEARHYPGHTMAISLEKGRRAAPAQLA